jgi:Cobyrinic acid a,c-diamide synthase
MDKGLDLNYRRLVIAGTGSGVGKTSIAIGIMKALIDKGYRVQGFKVGPDYIDPSYHTSITGRASRNLDPWLMREDGVIASFVNAMRDADVAVIEGVMGMYDGLSGKDDYASTAHVARILKSPVILVLDASKSARSIAAVALGFIRYGSSRSRYSRIKGVILNNIASDRHAEYCIDALEQLNIQVLGVVKRSNDIMLEERHLGLIPTYESKNIRDKAYKVAAYVKDHLNIDAIVGIVESSTKERIGSRHSNKSIDRINTKERC